MFQLFYRVLTTCSVVMLACSATAVLAQEDRPEFDIQVTKSVDNPTPNAPQQTIEFVIKAKNTGKKPAQNALVKDKLPPELAIPQGMVATTSSGTYEAATGIWSIDEIAPGERELLTIPTIVQASPQPACIINEAWLASPDANAGNNWYEVAIRRPEIERCVDLYLRWDRPIIIVGPEFCGGKQSVSYEFIAYNAGPHDAREVVLTLTETSSFKLPGLQFVSPDCAGLRCTWDSFPAGRSKRIKAQSSEFNNDQMRQHGIRLLVTTSDEDYVDGNDTYATTRSIESFTPRCPDYGIPEPTLPLAGGGGGCLIATAAYGTPFDARIDKLRRFRDEWLMPYAPGKKIVKLYYDNSPPLAEYIASRPWLRAIVRALLVPLIWFATYPIWCLLVAIACVSLLLWCKIRVANKVSPAQPSAD